MQIKKGFTMTPFNFKQFLLDQRITTKELAQKMGELYVTVSVMVKRGTIKLSFLRELEKRFGNLQKYIEVNQ